MSKIGEYLRLKAMWEQIAKSIKRQNEIQRIQEKENIVGAKWAALGLNRRSRASKITVKPLKPSPEGREDLIRRQKKARPVVRSRG